jgi:multiple sugar transport system permease protein/putative chitobiose transport system permease protein
MAQTTIEMVKPKSQFLSKKWRQRMVSGIVYILLVLVFLIIWLPFMWAISASFSPLDKVFVNALPFTWKALFPMYFTTQPYIDLFTKFGLAVPLKNTVILSFSTVVLGGLMSAMAGFAFARFEFRGKNLLFGVTLFTFMVPIETIIIPLYTMMHDMGWMNTWQGLLLPGLANGLTIFLFRQFFSELPQEVFDAARVDGASWFRIFFQLALPISKPVLISGALVLFLGAWNSFFWPLTVTSSGDMRVLQIAVSYTQSDHGVTLWNVRMAGAMLASIVPILILTPFQQYYVRGIASTGLSGQ